MEGADIGLIGLAVMGENLVLNMESKGFSVAVFNRTVSKVDDFLNGKAKGKKVIGTHSIEEFTGAIKKPRKIILMVKAGSPVDDFIELLLPHLEKGDIIIDGGNSFFQDTVRRAKYLEQKGIFLIGAGISGGEEGALKGPAIMPGGAKKAWDEVRHILQSIAAKLEDGTPCCEYIGENGAGHYVKMVHNGIEYADMQLISEAYFLMKGLLGMNTEEMQKTFEEWNRGDLNSYLIEITAEILKKKDRETGKPVVEIILDTAGQKGTGKWTSQNALDLGVPAPTIAEAVFARCISALKEERVKASKVLSGPAKRRIRNKRAFIKKIQDALYASKVCSYAQGFQLMKFASKEYSWNLNFGSIALIWRNGCIIRAKFLDRIKDAFDRNPNLENLLLDSYFRKAVSLRQENWREVVSSSIKNGIPVPAFTSAITYYDSYRTGRLPANLLQAQRDYFGAHTYERIDKKGIFHTDWQGNFKGVIK